MNGDKASRSVNLITTLPIDSLDGYVRGQLFYMYLKGNSDAMDKPRTSFSYMLQLEGNILPTIAVLLRRADILRLRMTLPLTQIRTYI